MNELDPIYKTCQALEQNKDLYTAKETRKILKAHHVEWRQYLKNLAQSVLIEK
tara:strand:+ start:5947 stop:6105 length:159 start_codon:yes stop_codon:yes gene_type:complete